MHLSAAIEVTFGTDPANAWEPFLFKMHFLENRQLNPFQVQFGDTKTP